MRFLITALLLVLPQLAFAQYVAQTIEERIKNDKASIALDQADIAAKQADIDSIVNDSQASQVTAQVPDVISSQQVLAK